MGGLGWLFETFSSGASGRMDSMNQEYRPSNEKSKRFTDVRGCPEAVAELDDIVQYLRNPSVYTDLGGKLPSGVLLTGPPGTGKTLLARAVAGEAGVPFFYASGSEFEEIYVGVGAKRVRELFAQAKKNAPCIVFVDEIDAVGSARNPKDQQAMKMTLNQLLVGLDGFNPSEGIIVLAATNFPQLLDKALVRPGRFDRDVTVPLPDVAGREQILKLYCDATGVTDLTTSSGGGADSSDGTVNLKTLARGTPGMSGADLSNLVNLASLQASLKGRDKITMPDFEHAKDRILMGAERKSAVISEEGRKLTAYHEAGHALVATYTQGADAIYKATIMPRGQSLGHVMQLPDKDETSITRRQLLAKMGVAMGGRVAEGIIFGDDNVTTGASSDLEQATKIARHMVSEVGMGSDAIGPVRFSSDDLAAASSATQEAVEREVKGLCIQATANAEALIKSKEKELHRLAQALLEYETLSGQEVKDVLAGKGIKTGRPKSTINKDGTRPKENTSSVGRIVGGAAALAKDAAQA